MGMDYGNMLYGDVSIITKVIHIINIVSVRSITTTVDRITNDVPGITGCAVTAIVGKLVGYVLELRTPLTTATTGDLLTRSVAYVLEDHRLPGIERSIDAHKVMDVHNILATTLIAILKEQNITDYANIIHVEIPNPGTQCFEVMEIKTPMVGPWWLAIRIIDPRMAIWK